MFPMFTADEAEKNMGKREDMAEAAINQSSWLLFSV